MTDDIRPSGYVTVPCTSDKCKGEWWHWVHCTDARLPDGPFLCTECANPDWDGILYKCACRGDEVLKMARCWTCLPLIGPVQQTGGN